MGNEQKMTVAEAVLAEFAELRADLAEMLGVDESAALEEALGIRADGGGISEGGNAANKAKRKAYDANTGWDKWSEPRLPPPDSDMATWMARREGRDRAPMPRDKASVGIIAGAQGHHRRVKAAVPKKEWGRYIGSGDEYRDTIRRNYATDRDRNSVTGKPQRHDALKKEYGSGWKDCRESEGAGDGGISEGDIIKNWKALDAVKDRFSPPHTDERDMLRCGDSVKKTREYWKLRDRGVTDREAQKAVYGSVDESGGKRCSQGAGPLYGADQKVLHAASNFDPDTISDKAQWLRSKQETEDALKAGFDRETADNIKKWGSSPTPKIKETPKAAAKRNQALANIRRNFRE